MEVFRKYAGTGRAAFALLRREGALLGYLLPAAAAFPLAYSSSALNALITDAAVPNMPFAALALIAGLWVSYKDAVLAASLGALVGCIASANMTGAAAVLLFGAVVFTLRNNRGLMLIYKAAILLAFLLAFIPVILATGMWRDADGAAFVAYLSMCGVCIGLALIDARALSVLNGSAGRKLQKLTDERLIALSALLGTIIAAFGRAEAVGIRLGVALTIIMSLLAVRARGTAGVAAASALALFRVFAVKGDNLFVAVLACCALTASLIRPLGKTATALAFSLPLVCFHMFTTGTAAPNIGEILFSGCVFLSIPEKSIRLFHFDGTSERTERAEKRAQYSRKKLIELADTLEDAARLCTGNGAAAVKALLNATAECADTLSEGERKKKPRISLRCGSYCMKQEGSIEAGDSSLTAKLGALELAAISDGMGSGRSAHAESERAIELYKRLVGCGFSPMGAAECVNELLILDRGGEMYATLDAAVIDTARGELTAVKHGAPPSFILRNDTLYTLYSEALPIGCVGGARPAVFRERLRAGDTLVMMSDGVYDHLSDGAGALIKEAVDTLDATLAAERLVLLALESGAGADDMTALVVKIGESY